MTHDTDISAEAVERLREILSYGLPSHVEIQTGEGTSSPNAVFADADFEVGDGICGLHASGKQANEPCIPYIRADALIYALAERDHYKARAERAEAALNFYGNKVEEYASDCPVMSDDAYDWLNKDAGKTARAALAQIDTEPASGMYGQYTPVTVSSRSEPITRDDARDLALADAYRAGLEAAADELMVEALACEGNLSVETAQKAIRALKVPTEFGGK